MLPDDSRKSSPLERDLANVTLDISFDLSSLFLYNTREVFVFVACEYKTKKNPVNQIVVWDRILLSPDEAVVDLRNEGAEYYITDQGFNLRGAEATLTVGWNVMPFTGQLYWGSSADVSTFAFPPEYTHNPVNRR